MWNCAGHRGSALRRRRPWRQRRPMPVPSGRGLPCWARRWHLDMNGLMVVGNVRLVWRTTMACCRCTRAGTRTGGRERLQSLPWTIGSMNLCSGPFGIGWQERRMQHSISRSGKSSVSLYLSSHGRAVTVSSSKSAGLPWRVGSINLSNHLFCTSRQVRRM
uniref:Uncharacterized protein n=1 Tax=Arundo donax TaxID=35708 RepID=A0A0A9HIE5_ARUDO